MNASSHRAAARAALKGKWVEAMLTSLVMMLVFIGISIGISALVIIPLIGFVLVLAVPLLVYAIMMGYFQYTLNLVDYKPTELTQIFSRFDLMWPVCKVFLLEIAIMFALAFGVGILGGFLVYLLGDLGSILLMVMLIAVYVFLFMFMFGMSMVYFVLLETPGITARAAMRRSWDLMQGNKFRFFCLEFSFFGWAILASFTFGIGYLILLPYMSAAMASFYRELVPGVVNRSNTANDPASYETYENYSYDALPSGENPIIDDDAGFTDFGNDSIDDSAIQTPGF